MTQEEKVVIGRFTEVVENGTVEAVAEVTKEITQNEAITEGLKAAGKIVLVTGLTVGILVLVKKYVGDK